MELLIRRQIAAYPLLLEEETAKTLLEPPLLTLLRREGKDIQGIEISLVLCDDLFIQDLNRRWRGLDKPTDVLSFPQDDPLMLGDIVISMDTAQKQANAADWPVESEVALLAVHGLLHLLGYDDTDEEGAALMQKKTVQALKDTGFALPPPSAHPFLA